MHGLYSRRGVISAVIGSVALMVAACGRGALSPTAPTPAPLRSTPVVPGMQWNLTKTLTAASGPAECIRDITQMNVGAETQWLLEIERAGETVLLTVIERGTPTNRDQYTGTIADDMITIPARGFHGTAWCGPTGPVTFYGTYHISGRLLDGGRELNAAEDLVVVLATGQTLDVHFDWRATPP